MLPYWQENLRVQILRSHNNTFKTADALSQCWANKWFFGCVYPKGVHDIIDEWPAPRKEDVDHSVKLPPKYSKKQMVNKLVVVDNNKNRNNKDRIKRKDIINNIQHLEERENEDIDLKINTNNSNNAKLQRTIGQKRSFSELNANNESRDSFNFNLNPKHPTKIQKLSHVNNNEFSNIIPQTSNPSKPIILSSISITKKTKKARPKWG
eukprot:UN12403